VHFIALKFLNLLNLASDPSKMTSSTEAGVDDDDNVRVVVRVRPFNQDETVAAYKNIVQVDGIHGTIR
jgi:hypothetical protein